MVIYLSIYLGDSYSITAMVHDYNITWSIYLGITISNDDYNITWYITIAMLLDIIVFII